MDEFRKKEKRKMKFTTKGLIEYLNGEAQSINTREDYEALLAKIKKMEEEHKAELKAKREARGKTVRKTKIALSDLDEIATEIIKEQDSERSESASKLESEDMFLTLMRNPESVSNKLIAYSKSAGRIEGVNKLVEKAREKVAKKPKPIKVATLTREDPKPEEPKKKPNWFERIFHRA